MTMFIDRNRAMLLASSEGLDALAARVAADGATPPDPQWFDAGILRPAGGGEAASPELEPMVAGIVELVTRPTRSVVLERFADGNGEVTFVNWDTRGRVAVIEGAGEGLVSIVATDLKLLPGRMIHAVGLRTGAPASDRPALTTTAAAIEAVLGGTAATAVGRMGMLGAPVPNERRTGRIEPASLPLVSLNARRFMPASR
jgi:hypothetical protein